MARPGWPERNRAARSFRQLRRFHHVINSDKVFGTHNLPSWDFEDEAEQSLGRPCRLTDSRSKRTYELTSSIVPRGTSSHRSVELECPPIAFDPERLLCRRDFPGPVELGAVKSSFTQWRSNPVSSASLQKTGIFRGVAGDFRQFRL